MTDGGIDYWIISTSGDTTGYYCDLQGKHVTGVNYHIGAYDVTQATILYDYWIGFSERPFRIDRDWLIGVTFSSYTSGCTWGICSYSNLPLLTLDTDFSSNTSNNNTLTYKLPAVLLTVNRTCGTINQQQWIHPNNSIYKDIYFTPSGVMNKEVSYIDINDLVVFVSGGGSDTNLNQSAHVAIVLACPKDKLSSDYELGDAFPHETPIDLDVTINVDETLNDWEQMQYDYAQEVVSYGLTENQLGALGSSNALIVSDVSDNAIGEFGVSNDQINNIADMLTGSFYLHVLTISGLFIVLLFFIKKGMA